MFGCAGCGVFGMQPHAPFGKSYAGRTVTRSTDRRDTATDAVQVLVDRAIDEPAKRTAIAHLLFGDHPVGGPPGNWPAPTAADRERARATCAQAARAARRHLDDLGVRVLYTSLGELPELEVTWAELPPDQELPPAPLLFQLGEDRAQRVIATLASYVFTRHTRRLWDADIRARLIQRLNAFAQVEINLWRFAADAGHTDPPPYPIRYDLARWLWHPSIGGVIFCLRCGTELAYARSARTRPDGATVDPHLRTGRCRVCSRGAETRWPPRHRASRAWNMAAPLCASRLQPAVRRPLAGPAVQTTPAQPTEPRTPASRRSAWCSVTTARARHALQPRARSRARTYVSPFLHARVCSLCCGLEGRSGLRPHHGRGIRVLRASRSSAREAWG